MLRRLSPCAVASSIHTPFHCACKHRTHVPFHTVLWLQASVEEGVAVKDMTEQRFLESLARREVLRRTAEAAQIAQMVS